MIEKLKIDIIYDDFLKNVSLTDEQIRILNMYIKRETRYKISREIGVSERTVGNEVIKLKKLYKDYCNLQETKANVKRSNTTKYDVICINSIIIML